MELERRLSGRNDWGDNAAPVRCHSGVKAVNLGFGIFRLLSVFQSLSDWYRKSPVRSPGNGELEETSIHSLADALDNGQRLACQL
jgi:hypothetical protein